jgi:hypothetical protein
LFWQLNKGEFSMSKGVDFVRFVNTLHSLDFPVDRVSGSDIQTALDSGVDIQTAVLKLYKIAETKRRRQILNKNNNQEY